MSEPSVPSGDESCDWMTETSLYLLSNDVSRDYLCTLFSFSNTFINSHVCDRKRTMLAERCRYALRCGWLMPAFGVDVL